MNRRLALSVMLATGAEALAAPVFQVRRVQTPRATVKPDCDPRLLLFMSNGCSGCVAVDRLLEQDNPVVVLKTWTHGFGRDNIIQFVDKNKWPDAAEKFRADVTPCFVLVKGGIEIGRVDPDVENWDALDFIRAGQALFNGDDPAVTLRLMQAAPVEVVWTPPPMQVIQAAPQRVIVPQRRVERPVGYPVRPDWPFDGWIEQPWQHLAGDRNHSGRFPTQWLRSLSWAETQSLHADHHRQCKGIGMVHWEYVPKV